MIATKKVSAVIVTYNRLELLKEALAAVFNQTYSPEHIIIVDNLSTDGTKEYLDSLQDQRFLIHHSLENLGGAGGFNQGVRLFAEETEDDYVWLMDDDAIPEPTALQYLVEFMDKHPHVGFVNSVVRWGSINGRPSYMNVQAPRGFSWQMYLNDSANPAVEVVNSSFVSVMIPRLMVAKVGLPQKEYFIWGDDIEYTNRIADIYRGYTVINSLVVHKSQKNSAPGNIVEEEDSKRLWRYVYEFRNRLLTARRVDGKRGFFHMFQCSLKHDLRHVWFKKAVKFRWRKTKIIFQGIFQGIFFNPPIEFAKGVKDFNVRSINRLMWARFLSDPQKIITLDEHLDIVENAKFSDFAGKTKKADQFIRKMENTMVED